MVEEEIKFMIDVNEIELDGKIYVAEETDPDNDCRGCAFGRLSDYCAKIVCYSGDRADGRTVIFVEKDGAQLNNGANNTGGKEDEFKLPDNMKFWCESKEYGAKVQEKLFELGYKWGYMDKHRVLHPNGIDRYTIYADKEQLLSWGDRCDYEMNDDHPKYHIIETTGEIVPIDKETQEGKIATEVVTNNNETESLDSLFNQIVLLQKENDSLVEQKEQLVNKISANTQSINILKDKMSEKVGSVGLVLAGVDKATDDWKFVSHPNK